MRGMRFLRGKRAVSPLMATVITILIVLAVGLAVAAMTIGWFKGAGVAQLDASQSHLYCKFNPETGRILLIIRNVGTATAQIQRIAIRTDDINTAFEVKDFAADGTVEIYRGDADCASGKWYGSSPGVGAGSDNILTLPQQTTVTVDAQWVGWVWGFWSVGKDYVVTIYPPQGRGTAVDIIIKMEPYP